MALPATGVGVTPPVVLTVRAGRNELERTTVGSRRGTLEMIYKMFAYATILFGGMITGGLIASLIGPVQIRLSAHDVWVIGACLGAVLAMFGCRFAIEHHEASERNRELIRTLEHRVALLARIHDSDPR